MFVDTHCHLNIILEKFKDLSLDQLLNEIDEAGVKRLLTISASPKDLSFVLDVVDKYEQVFGTLGIHPHDAKELNDDLWAFITKNLEHPKIKAVGEIGLDYYYEYSPKNVQKEVFSRFLDLAIERELPVIIHSREAEEDTLALLKNVSKEIRGVVHCFTGSLDFAEKLLRDYPNLYLGFTGVVTFKNAKEIVEVVSHTPVERILIETDSPFMAPVPNRGKPCTPCYIPLIVEKIASIKEINSEELLEITNQNSQFLFE